MIAALLLADLALVVAVSTFAMLLYYLIANIAAIRFAGGKPPLSLVGADDRGTELFRAYRFSYPVCHGLSGVSGFLLGEPGSVSGGRLHFDSTGEPEFLAPKTGDKD